MGWEPGATGPRGLARWRKELEVVAAMFVVLKIPVIVV